MSIRPKRRPGVLLFSGKSSREKSYERLAINVSLVASLAGVAGFSAPSRVETGQVAVVISSFNSVANNDIGYGMISVIGRVG